MSIFKEYNYPTASTNNVAISQTPVDGMEIILNGSLAELNNSFVNFISKGFVPKITFTSTTDISNIILIIKGK